MCKEDQPWFKQAHIASFLELFKSVNLVKNLDLREICSPVELGPTFSHANGSS